MSANGATKKDLFNAIANLQARNARLALTMYDIIEVLETLPRDGQYAPVLTVLKYAKDAIKI